MECKQNASSAFFVLTAHLTYFAMASSISSDAPVDVIALALLEILTLRAYAQAVHDEVKSLAERPGAPARFREFTPIAQRIALSGFEPVAHELAASGVALPEVDLSRLQRQLQGVSGLAPTAAEESTLRSQSLHGLRRTARYLEARCAHCSASLLKLGLSTLSHRLEVWGRHWIAFEIALTTLMDASSDLPKISSRGRAARSWALAAAV